LTHKCIFNSTYVPYLKLLSQVCIYLGLFWLTMVNFMFTTPLDVSKNTFDKIKHNSFPYFKSSNHKTLINSILTELINLHESPLYNQSTMNIEYLQNITNKLNFETYIQEFPVYTSIDTNVKGHNVYTYLRSKRSLQKDCLLIAYRHSINQYNMAYHLAVSNINAKKTARYAEIATVIALMHYLKEQDWLSRDVIFLGYDGEFQYGTAIRHFLEEYYYGEDEKFVRGGIIRQGIALEFKTDTFNTYALQFRTLFILTL